MNEREFVCESQLRPTATAVGVEDAVVQTAADLGLNGYFQPVDAGSLPGIEAQVAAISAVLGTDPPPPATMGVNRTVWRTMRGVHHGVIKWNATKIREAVALATLAESMAVAERLHVHDVCGGKGAVALYIEFLREHMSRLTTGTCWELEAGRQEGHEWIRKWLHLASPLDFRPSDVAHADLSRKADGKTHALAKHACGPLTDAVFANVDTLPSAGQPHVTAVMTCCHSYLAGTEAFWPASMPLAIRQEIARRADPHKEHDPYLRDVLGPVCRRIIDTLRARHIGGQVTEALPFGKEAHRNYVISRKRA